MAIRKTGAAADQVIYDEAAALDGLRLAAEASAQEQQPWTDADEAGLAEEDLG